MTYEQYLHTAQFGNALFHFGWLEFDPQMECNSEYHNAEVKECLTALEQFPVVMLNSKPSKNGNLTITCKWTFGETGYRLPPNQATNAYNWAEALRKQYYSYTGMQG